MDQSCRLVLNTATSHLDTCYNQSEHSALKIRYESDSTAVFMHNRTLPETAKVIDICSQKQEADCLHKEAYPVANKLLRQMLLFTKYILSGD